MKTIKYIIVFLIGSLISSCALAFTEKSVLISYTVYVDGGDEFINCIEGYGQPKFILYNNGQLIIFKDRQYQEVVLSKNEVNSLLDKIEETGIMQLDSVEELGFDELIIKENIYHFARTEFHYNQIELTMEIIDQFSPINTKPYSPDDLLLWIHDIESIDEHKDILPQPIPQIKTWPSELQSISQYGRGYHTIHGNKLPLVMAQFYGFPDYQIFKEGNTLYLSAICANFPDI